MKILIENTFFSLVGGAEIISYKIYKLLKKHGHEVVFFATDKKPYFEDNYPYSKYFVKYRSGVINYLKNPVRYYSDTQTAQKFKTLLEVFKPDVVHFNSIPSFLFPIVSTCATIPSVMTLHDAVKICPAGTLMLKNKHYCKNIYCKNKKFYNCIINNCSGNIEQSIRYTLSSYLHSDKLKYIDKFITPSEALKKAYINSNIGINENRIVTINNFLSDEELKTTSSYTNKGYFLYVGRLSKEKGVNYLLEAIKDLPKDIKLHIAGTGPEEASLKNYAKQHNLDNVKFLGFKTGEELKEEYQNCIALIVPSNCFESFGMINIEAFINGKPVIASNIGGIPEIVEHNKTGLLFEPENVQQFKECIIKYYNNPELAIKHGQNGYQKAIVQYTEDKYYNELIKVYEEVINGYKC